MSTILDEWSRDDYNRRAAAGEWGWQVAERAKEDIARREQEAARFNAKCEEERRAKMTEEERRKAVDESDWRQCMEITLAQLVPPRFRDCYPRQKDKWCLNTSEPGKLIAMWCDSEIMLHVLIARSRRECTFRYIHHKPPGDKT